MAKIHGPSRPPRGVDQAKVDFRRIDRDSEGQAILRWRPEAWR
jgi:hypothetical protein